MTQKTSTPSVSAESQLHPLLKSTLECLDIDLETELKRYRRYQAGKPVPTVRSLGSYQSSSTPAIGISHPTHISESLAASAENSAEIANSFQTSLAASEQATKIQFPPEEGNGDSEVDSQAEGETTDQSQNSLAATTSDSSHGWEEKSEEGEGNTGSPSGLAADFSPSQGFAYQENDLGPEDYLASSQELLRNLNVSEPVASSPEKEPTKRADAGKTHTRSGLLLFFLLVGGGAIAYLWQHPQLAERLHVGRFFPKTAQPSNQNTTQASNSTSEAPMPLAPNLANKEFIDLELDNLSTVHPQAQSVQVPEESQASRQAVSPNNQTSPSPSTSSNPIPPKDGDNRLGNLPTALMGEPPSEENNASSETTENENESEPAATSAAPSNQTAAEPSFAGEVSISGGDGYFYVVMPYDGASSLERAQEAIADAYVREFPIGKTIQLGAFDDIATAKEMVKRLSQQGIQTQVYQP